MVYLNQIKESGISILDSNAIWRVGSLTASLIYPKGGILLGDIKWEMAGL